MGRLSSGSPGPAWCCQPPKDSGSLQLYLRSDASSQPSSMLPHIRMETRICFISRRTTRPRRLCTPRSLLNLEFLPETRCMCFQSFWAHGCCISYFKSNVRETWRVILVSKAGIFLSESLRMRSKSIQGVFLLHLFRNDCKII